MKNEKTSISSVAIRGGALQGTGEQIANGRITLLLFLLSPNLASLVFYSELDFNRGSDRGGRVCQVQPSSESLSFSQDTVGTKHPGHFRTLF